MEVTPALIIVEISQRIRQPLNKYDQLSQCLCKCVELHVIVVNHTCPLHLHWNNIILHFHEEKRKPTLFFFLSSSSTYLSLLFLLLSLSPSPLSLFLPWHCAAEIMPIKCACQEIRYFVSLVFMLLLIASLSKHELNTSRDAIHKTEKYWQESKGRSVKGGLKSV